MSLGDMADKLVNLKKKKRTHNKSLNKRNRLCKELLFYDEDLSAGGTMTTGYISINKDMTALEAT